MSKIRLALLIFCVFLGLVVYTADVGSGARYWGWLEKIPLGDKVGHCTLMFTFCLLANLALRCRSTGPGHAGLLIGTAVVAVVVASEEFSQIWIPGRDFDLLDLAADAVGIACADLVSRALRGRFGREPRMSGIGSWGAATAECPGLQGQAEI